MSFFDKLGKTVTNTAHSVVEKPSLLPKPFV